MLAVTFEMCGEKFCVDSWHLIELHMFDKIDAYAKVCSIHYGGLNKFFDLSYSKEAFKLTVTCPFGVSGGSHVIIIIDALNGRTWTFRGALSISVVRCVPGEKGQTQKESKHENKMFNELISTRNRLMEQLHGLNFSNNLG